MTENEVVKIIREYSGLFPQARGEEEALEMAIKALEELQQYRAIGTLEECQKSVEICKSMIERNITPENMQEYMKFEDECISEGFTFNSLLEAREKQKARKTINGCCPNCCNFLPTKELTGKIYCMYCGQLILANRKVKKYCSTCKFYATYEGICCNGDSEYRAGFRNLDDTCEKWEEVENDDN